MYLLLSDQEVYDNDVLCENCKKDVKEKLKKDIPPNGVPLNPGWVNIMDPRSVTGPRSRRS